MSEHHVSPWYVDRVGEAVVERLAALHSPNAEAVAKGVDLVGDPHREDDAGCAVNRWQRSQLRRWRAGDRAASPLHWAALASFTVGDAR